MNPNIRRNLDSGTATYTHPDLCPPAYVIDAVPGARAAWNEYEKTIAAAKVVRSEQRAAIAEGVRLMRSATGIEPLEDERSANTKAKLRIEARLRDMVSDSERALRRFDAIVATAKAEGRVEPLLAARALEAQKAAEEAYTALLVALKDRDDAYNGLGRPAIFKHWETADSVKYGKKSIMDVALAAVVKRFPVAEVEQIAEGGAK